MPPTRGTISIARTQGSAIQTPPTRHLRRRDRARQADGLWQRHGRRSAFAAAYGAHVRLLSQTFHSKRVAKTYPVDFASGDRLIKKLRFFQSAALPEQYSRTREAPSICPGGRR